MKNSSFKQNSFLLNKTNQNTNSRFTNNFLNLNQVSYKNESTNQQSEIKSMNNSQNINSNSNFFTQDLKISLLKNDRSQDITNNIIQNIAIKNSLIDNQNTNDDKNIFISQDLKNSFFKNNLTQDITSNQTQNISRKNSQINNQIINKQENNELNYSKIGQNVSRKNSQIINQQNEKLDKPSINLIQNENFLNISKSLPNFDQLIPILNKIETKEKQNCFSYQQIYELNETFEFIQQHQIQKDLLNINALLCKSSTLLTNNGALHALQDYLIKITNTSTQKSLSQIQNNQIEIQKIEKTIKLCKWLEINESNQFNLLNFDTQSLKNLKLYKQSKNNSYIQLNKYQSEDNKSFNQQNQKQSNKSYQKFKNEDNNRSQNQENQQSLFQDYNQLFDQNQNQNNLEQQELLQQQILQEQLQQEQQQLLLEQQLEQQQIQENIKKQKQLQQQKKKQQQQILQDHKNKQQQLQQQQQLIQDNFKKQQIENDEIKDYNKNNGEEINQDIKITNRLAYGQNSMSKQSPLQAIQQIEQIQSNEIRGKQSNFMKDQNEIDSGIKSSIYNLLIQNEFQSEKFETPLKILIDDENSSNFVQKLNNSKIQQEELMLSIKEKNQIFQNFSNLSNSLSKPNINQQENQIDIENQLESKQLNHASKNKSINLIDYSSDQNKQQKNINITQVELQQNGDYQNELEKQQMENENVTRQSFHQQFNQFDLNNKPQQANLQQKNRTIISPISKLLYEKKKPDNIQVAKNQIPRTNHSFKIFKGNSEQKISQNNLNDYYNNKQKQQKQQSYQNSQRSSLEFTSLIENNPQKSDLDEKNSQKSQLSLSHQMNKSRSGHNSQTKIKVINTNINDMKSFSSLSSIKPPQLTVLQQNTLQQQKQLRLQNSSNIQNVEIKDSKLRQIHNSVKDLEKKILQNSNIGKKQPSKSPIKSYYNSIIKF